MDTRFVKRIIKATEDLDTLVYLSYESFNAAMVKWLKDLTNSLNDVVDIFEGKKGREKDISAGVSNFTERKLEQTHKEFLDRVSQYVDGIDLAFARKALQYSKIAIKLHGPKTINEKVLKDIQDAERYLKEFESAIKRVRNYSSKLMGEIKEKKLENIQKYKPQFDRLALFERLTLDLAISLLREKAEI